MKYMKGGSSTKVKKEKWQFFKRIKKKFGRV